MITKTKSQALQRIALEALRQGYDICTNTRLRRHPKEGYDYHIDIKIRSRNSDFNLVFLSQSPTSHELNRLAVMTRETFPYRVIIINLDGGDWDYHLGQIASKVTITIDRIWKFIEELEKSSCIESVVEEEKKEQ